MLSRARPSPDLSYFIQHYWFTTWQLPQGESHVAETLPSPFVHLVTEKSSSAVYGVMTERFSRSLAGSGHAFGVAFRPGTFYGFYGAPISSLTNRKVSFASIFGESGAILSRQLIRAGTREDWISHIETFLTARMPKKDATVEEVRNAVERIMKDRSITRAEQISSMMGMNLRSLQRLFARYVGVSPKWVIQRYRLQEAAHLLVNGNETATDVAIELGYFDQAHFIRDFKSVVGLTPATYVALNSSPKKPADEIPSEQRNPSDLECRGS
jgi:AraC-like DNA-binding protein